MNDRATPHPPAAASSPGVDASLAHARALLARHPVADGHNDLAWVLRTTGMDPAAGELRAGTPFQTDLPRLRRGGVGVQVWSAWVPAEHGVRTQLEQLELVRRLIASHPDDLALALSADDVEQALARGRIASLVSIEGGHAIEGSLGVLRAYHALGARVMTLTHAKTIAWADSATDEPRHGGLTRFGEEVVREMNRLGMLVDLSHVSDEAMQVALRVSQAPVVFTHSSARALCDTKRNVPDVVLRDVARNGGLVMVTFAGLFVSDAARAVHAPALDQYYSRVASVKDPAARRAVRDEIFAKLPPAKVTVAQVADHVEHVRRVAGVDHVGLGGDYDGVEGLPEGMEDVSGYPLLFAELVRRGWADEDLAKLASGSFLRVLRAAGEIGRRLRAERPPSTATIAELDGPRAGPAA